MRLRRWIETSPQESRTISYNANLQPSGETFPSAFFGGRILTRSYDSLNRPTGFELGTSADPDADHAVTYGYDAAGRLATVQDPSRTWTYSFVPNTASLLSGVTSGNFSVAFTYEPGRNAINSVENKVGGNTVSAFTYTNNALGQRTARGQSGSAFTAPATEDFGYNAKGEVISSTHSLDALRNTIYAYDGIGNRNEATFGGITTAYTANALNQYSDLTPSNLPTFTPTYDFDGNMLSDGAGKRFVWDGDSRPEGRVARDSKAARRVPMAAGSGRHQNRLIEVRDETNALIATYTYDGQSRRVKKVTTSAAPQGATEEIYLYDGWNRVATYQPATGSLQLVATATWGRDLSGTIEGAGGVGGLLGVKDGSNGYVLTYDANGSVSELINGSGSVSAHYEYDPFGNVVVSTGSYAAANPWRFSTKPVDPETGYSYYGYRYYNPQLGRWMNRDPIAERGGVNLYGFNFNSPLIYIDPLGLDPIGKGCCSEEEVDRVGKEASQRASQMTQNDPHGREYGGLICCKNGKVKATPPHPGPVPTKTQLPSGRVISNAQIDPRRDDSTSPGKVVSCNDLYWFGGAVEVAAYHSHPDNSGFSDEDKGYADRNKFPFFKGTPDGDVERTDPDPNFKPGVPGSGGKGPIKTVP